MINRGFTLIEVIIAIFLITAGTAGSFALIQRTIALTTITSSRLQASYFAQEGMEIVRNIRDTNWLEKRADPGVLWDDGIPAGDREADYKSGNLNQAYAGNLLQIDGDNFYSYTAGTLTQFKRKITISKPQVDILEVSVEVSWQERGRTHQVIAQTELHNWR